MAIEKMYMMNIVGPIDHLDKLSKLLVIQNCMQPVNALREIDSSDFLLETSKDNLEAMIDVCYIRPFSIEREYSEVNQYIKFLTERRENLGIKDSNEKDFIYEYSECEEKIKSIYSDFQILWTKFEKMKEEEEYLNKSIISLDYMKDFKKNIREILELKNFKVCLYKVKRDGMSKLKENYENIPAIIEKITNEEDDCLFLAIIPNVFEVEVKRIFDSAACEKLEIPSQYDGTPTNVSKFLSNKLKILKMEKEILEKEINIFFKKRNREISICKKSLELDNKAMIIKRNTACTNEFFYSCGWVPETMIKEFNKVIEKFDKKLLVIKKTTEEEKVSRNSSPPTKLKNNKLFKPFESMVSMYGVPTYGEIDPTVFLSISYTLMFGAMFGDVGQGGILLLMGIFLKYKKSRVNLGGILGRLGISSIIFGFLYGSIFGSEEIINAILVRPMEDINDVLLYAIVFGCAFLILGFILGIINKLRRKDIEQGIFGKDGIAGFIFYIVALILVVSKILEIKIFSTSFLVAILVLMLISILLKGPITNIIKGKKQLFDEGARDYFIESSFEVIETVLSLFSNTVSFIRVGAFALNHVGLFVAFATMANMMKNGVGSVFILVLGNVIIIGLEGLIVFIQGLRLQYYELFSKYYDGAGEEFNPVGISVNN